MSVLIEAQHGSEADWWHYPMDSRCCDPDTVSDSGPILMHVRLSISDNREWKNLYQDQSMGLFYSIQFFITDTIVWFYNV